MSTPELEQIQDHAAIVVPLLLSQYQQSARLLGLVRSGCAQADDLEEALFQIRSGYWLSSAIGAQLDVLGRVYREQRNGRTDEDYRTAIKVRASMLVSGNPEEILAFYRFSLGATDLVYQAEYPAGFVLLTDDETFGQGTLDTLSPAGVQGAFGNPITDALGNPMLTATGAAMYVVRS